MAPPSPRAREIFVATPPGDARRATPPPPAGGTSLASSVAMPLRSRRAPLPRALATTFAVGSALGSLVALAACSSGPTGNTDESDLEEHRAWSGEIDARACGTDAALPASSPLLRCEASADAAPVALAVCGDLTADNTLDVEMADGRADLAVTGRARTGSPLHVAGSFTALLGIDAPNTQDVRGDLLTNGDYTVSSPANVGGNAYVAGRIVAHNALQVTGTVHTPVDSGDNVTAGAVETGPVSVAAPVDCAAAPDVARLTRDALADERWPFYGAPLGAFARIDRPTRLRVGCGRYHWSELGIDNEFTVDVEGPTVIVIDHDVRVGAPTRFRVAPGASLDLVVGGDLRIDNTLEIRGGDVPSWIGVARNVRVGSPTILEGWLIAPRGEVAGDNTLDLRGAAFVGALRVGSPMTVRGPGRVSAEGCVLR